MSFGQRLSKALKDQELTRYRLSKLTGLSPSYIGYLVSGERGPSDDVIEKLSPAIGVPVEEMRSWMLEDRLSPEDFSRLGREYIRQRLAEIRQQSEVWKEKVNAAETEEELIALQPELEQLKKDARELDALDIQQKDAEQPPAPAAPQLKALDGGLEPPDDAPEQPDEWELEVLRKIGSDTDLGDLDPRRGGYLWYLDKSARRRVLVHMEEIWEEHQEYLAKHPEKRQHGAG